MDEGQSGRLSEARINVNGGLGRRFVVGDSSATHGTGHGTQSSAPTTGRSDAKFFRPGTRNAPFLFLVNLIAQHHEGKVRWSIPAEATADIAQEFFLPALQMVQTARIGHIIDQQTGVGSPVECRAQALEPLLTGRVPDLQRARLGKAGGRVGHRQILGKKVRADGRLVLAGKGPGVISVHERRLSDAGITEQNDLEQRLLLTTRLTVRHDDIRLDFFEGYRDTFSISPIDFPLHGKMCNKCWQMRTQKWPKRVLPDCAGFESAATRLDEGDQLLEKEDSAEKISGWCQYLRWRCYNLTCSAWERWWVGGK